MAKVAAKAAAYFPASPMNSSQKIIVNYEEFNARKDAEHTAAYQRRCDEKKKAAEKPEQVPKKRNTPVIVQYSPRKQRKMAYLGRNLLFADEDADCIRWWRLPVRILCDEQIIEMNDVEKVKRCEVHTWGNRIKYPYLTFSPTKPRPAPSTVDGLSNPGRLSVIAKCAGWIM